MSSVKWPATGALALSLALALSGCAGADAPRMGGVAAEVDGQTISLDDVGVLTDALCASNVATGDPRYTRPRSQMQADVLGALVQAALVDELGLGTQAQNTVDTDQVPGFADMSDEEQRELKDFLDDDARLRVALQELGDPSAQSPEEAAQSGLDALAEQAAAAEVDVDINPRYELSFEDGSITGGGGLSTPVGVEATRGEEMSAEYLGSLPEAQLCGAAPDAAATG